MMKYCFVMTKYLTIHIYDVIMLVLLIMGLVKHICKNMTPSPSVKMGLHYYLINKDVAFSS